MIGIMADSHDNLFMIRKAILLFNEERCNLVIHAGDFVAPFSAKELESLNCPVKAVFGNCDGEKRGLEKVLEGLGEVKKAPLAFTHQDLRFLVTHLNSPLKSYLAQGKYDVLIFGHTHRPEIRREQGALLINPGESGGWLTGKSTVALLETKTLSAEIRIL